MNKSKEEKLKEKEELREAKKADKSFNALVKMAKKKGALVYDR